MSIERTAAQSVTRQVSRLRNIKLSDSGESFTPEVKLISCIYIYISLYIYIRISSGMSVCMLHTALSKSLLRRLFFVFCLSARSAGLRFWRRCLVRGLDCRLPLDRFPAEYWPWRQTENT
jgi:hypothetical protein